MCGYRWLYEVCGPFHVTNGVLRLIFQDSVSADGPPVPTHRQVCKALLYPVVLQSVGRKVGYKYLFLLLLFVLTPSC